MKICLQKWINELFIIVNPCIPGDKELELLLLLDEAKVKVFKQLGDTLCLQGLLGINDYLIKIY